MIGSGITRWMPWRNGVLVLALGCAWALVAERGAQGEQVRETRKTGMKGPTQKTPSAVPASEPRSVIRVELLTPEEFAKYERTFTPPPRVRKFVATIGVQAGAVVVAAADPKLQAHLERLVSELGKQGKLLLPRTHTQVQVGGSTESIHRPGERVGSEDPQYLFAMEQSLGRISSDPATYFEGRQLVLRYDSE